MSHFSPLLWLCSITAVALSSFTVLDPTGVYADYLASLEDDAPAISAFFSAAQDGVFPWSELPETPSAPDPTPELPIAPELPEVPTAPVNPFTSVDESYFTNALFLGDSHTDGLHCYAPFPGAAYYTRNGMLLRQVFTKSYVELDGEKCTLEEALAEQHFGKIYIMLGINEVNFESVESYIEQYRAMLAQLHELQPDALIFVQSILHTTQEQSETGEFKNENIDLYNAALQQLADNKTVFYLNINSAFDDETGAMCAELSGDGIHVRAPYYSTWRDLLCEFGVVESESEIQ